MHNLGEGLAIGSSFAVGELQLGTFLIVGFMIHNVTEGLGIAAPVAEGERRPHLPASSLLALVAGAPAILGAWIGGYVTSDVLGVLFFAAAAGAALQVVVEVGRFVARRAPGGLRLGLRGRRVPRRDRGDVRDRPARRLAGLALVVVAREGEAGAVEEVPSAVVQPSGLDDRHVAALDGVDDVSVARIDSVAAVAATGLVLVHPPARPRQRTAPGKHSTSPAGTIECGRRIAIRIS